MLSFAHNSIHVLTQSSWAGQFVDADQVMPLLCIVEQAAAICIHAWPSSQLAVHAEVNLHAGNLLKVTEGPDAGKLALLDFGLVAEIPGNIRAAMVLPLARSKATPVGKLTCSRCSSSLPVAGKSCSSKCIVCCALSTKLYMTDQITITVVADVRAECLQCR